MKILFSISEVMKKLNQKTQLKLPVYGVARKSYDSPKLLLELKIIAGGKRQIKSASLPMRA